MSAHPGVLVLAKAPIAGLAKTRVAADVGDAAAAEIAAACLLDTLDVVESWVGPGHRVLALAGDLRLASRGSEIAARLRTWSVAEQCGTGLGERIYAAHRAAYGLWGPGRTVLQVGMDTPSMTATDLAELSEPILSGRTDAGLGLAADGGWWGLMTSTLSQVASVTDVPMSRPDTGSRTLAALTGRGLSVGLGPVLRDVDTFDDAMRVSTAIPHSHLAETLVRLAALTP